MSWNQVEKMSSESNNEFYKLETGENKFRILTDPVLISKYYNQSEKKSYIVFKNCGYEAEGKIRWLCYVYDYRTQQIKLGEFPQSVMKQVLDYKNNPEYAFDTAPMPYDITVTKKGEKLETEYTVIPARTNSDIDEKILQELATKKTCEEIKKSMQDNQLKKLSEDLAWRSAYEKRLQSEVTTESNIEYPTDDINVEDIPF